MPTTWSGLINQLTEYAKIKRIPISGTFELTSRCNLRCKMCYISQPVNNPVAMELERSAGEWIRLAQEVRDAGALYLLLTGGEVFLRKDFRTIYEQISSMGFNIQIYTNATMVTPEIAKWLGRIPPSKVSVTLYGASPVTYERVCGNADAFEHAVRGIDLLIAEGITLEVKTTVVRGNVDDFDKLTEFVEKRGLDLGIVNYISPRREGCNTDPEEERLSPLELINYEMRVEKYYNRKKAESILNGKEANNPVNVLHENALTTNINEPFRCSAGKCAFWISWDGRMIPCGLINNLGTTPFKDGFIPAWEELKDLCSSVPVCVTCKMCSIKESCLTCPARLVTETEFFDKPAPYLCETAQRRNELKIIKAVEHS